MDKLLAQYANIPANQRYLLAGLVAFGIVGGYYYFFYDAQQTALAELTAQVEQRQSQRLEKEGVRDNLAQFENKIAGLQQQLDAARARLPDAADVPQLLAQLGNRARLVGLDIVEFKPGAEESREFYGEMVFEMQVVGSYHEIAMFIDSVAKLDRIINVSDIVMDAPRDAVGKVALNGRFKLKAYRFLEPSGGKG